MPANFPSVTSVEKYVTNDFPKALITEHIADIKTRINSRTNFYDKFEYMYFVNQRNQLAGVIPIIKLLELSDKAVLAEHITTLSEVKYCTVKNTIEEAIHKALHFGFTAMPVVDENKCLLGILSAKTLLRMEAKMLESRGYRYSGFVHKDTLYTLAASGSVYNLVLARVPWLLLGALGGLVAAQYVGFFEATLEQNIILAFFIPTIVYMSDAAGTQTETLFIRTIAISEKTKLAAYFIRDMLVTTCLGSLVGAFLCGAVYLWKHDLQISLIIGLSMCLGITLSSPVAMTIPMLLRKLGKDPAVGSGPLATIIQDVVSLMVYFAVATLVLKFM